MVKKCINCRSASKERLKPHSDKQWTAVKGDDPYKFCFNGSATHVTSQVLQAKQVNKWYRGSHMVISVHSRSRQIGSIVWTNLKGYSNELHFLRDTTADSWVSTEIGNFLISPTNCLLQGSNVHQKRCTQLKFSSILQVQSRRHTKLQLPYQRGTHTMSTEDTL